MKDKELNIRDLPISKKAAGDYLKWADKFGESLTEGIVDAKVRKEVCTYTQEVNALLAKASGEESQSVFSDRIGELQLLINNSPEIAEKQAQIDMLLEILSMGIELENFRDKKYRQGFLIIFEQINMAANWKHLEQQRDELLKNYDSETFGSSTEPSREVVKWASKLGQFLADGNKNMTTSQLRKFFGEVKSIQAEGYHGNEGRFNMLYVHLAYAVGRNAGSKVKYFQEAIEPFMELVSKAENEAENTFINFVRLMEAIVAFHKEAGGK